MEYKSLPCHPQPDHDGNAPHNIYVLPGGMEGSPGNEADIFDIFIVDGKRYSGMSPVPFMGHRLYIVQKSPWNDDNHLGTSAEGVATALHAVLDDEEAGELRDEGAVALREVGWRREVAVQLQAPVALVRLLEALQLPQAPVHLHAPAHTWPCMLTHPVSRATLEPESRTIMKFSCCIGSVQVHTPAQTSQLYLKF